MSPVNQKLRMMEPDQRSLIQASVRDLRNNIVHQNNTIMILVLKMDLP